MSIEFKGDLYTIPADATLVLKVRGLLTDDMRHHICADVRQALGPEPRVLVIDESFEAFCMGAQEPVDSANTLSANLLKLTPLA